MNLLLLAADVTDSNLLAARMQMALTLATAIWGWAVAQYPFVVPPAIRVDSAPAPAAVLQLMAWSTARGMLIVVPSIFRLMSLFKSQQAMEK